MLRNLFAVLLIAVVFTTPAEGVQIQDAASIWPEFVDLVKSGRLSTDRLRPYHESMGEPLLDFLDTMRDKATWEEWEKDIEVHSVGEQIHFLIPLTFDGETHTYTFSFLLEGEEWYFQHLEAISIRFDQVGDLPTSTFPDLSAEKKTWIREEIRVSEMVRSFKHLEKREGRESALQWFKDGAGYALSARSWIPFVRARDAFVFYLCWEQSRLRGNHVVLEELDEEKARLRIEPIYFNLYEQTGHLKQQISIEDYRAIFETIWQDRAREAGWELTLVCENGRCLFEFGVPESGRMKHGPYSEVADPAKVASERHNLRSWAFCHCMYHCDPEFRDDGSSAAYFEIGAHFLPAFKVVDKAARVFIQENAYSSKFGLSLCTMKCLDFF